MRGTWQIGSRMVRAAGLLFAFLFTLIPTVILGDSPAARLASLADEIGGHSSTHILVKVAPAKLGWLNEPSPEIAAKNASWGVAGWRPAYGYPFANGELAHRLGLDRTFVLEVPPGTDTPAMAAAYRAIEGVESAEIDGIGTVAGLIPDDPNFDLQWNMHNKMAPPAVADADIDAPEAWELHTGEPPTGGGESWPVVVAIVDSGIDPHAEFAAPSRGFADRLVPGINTNDPNNPDLTTAPPGCPHGNHIAGIVAARGNDGLGIAGVNWGALLMPVRVLNGSCQGTEMQCANGILWAVDNGAQVINVGLQFYQGTDFLRFAVDYATAQGALVIAPVGNSLGEIVSFPARFDNAIAVTATNIRDLFSLVSNYGPEVDLSAPGEMILSTWTADGYAVLSGSSMAAPHVSGAAALLKSYDPSLTGAAIRSILEGSADDLGPAGWDDRFGWGRLNVYQALCAVAPPESAGACTDAIDNDCNGFTDCADSGCADHPACVCAADGECDDAIICTCDSCEAGICVHSAREFGDLDCSGGPPDFEDILCALNGFIDMALCPQADLAPPCTGDGIMDVDDVVTMLNAFVGFDPCGC